MSDMLIAGQPAPWFHAPALDGNDRYAFSSAAGRWIVMLFLDSATSTGAGPALDLVREHRDLFDDDRAAFFGVTTDRADVEHRRIAQILPGIRWFLDYEGKVSADYGALRRAGGQMLHTPHWLLLDPMLRVRARTSLADGHRLLAHLRELVGQPAAEVNAPVLVVPEIFPPDLCRHLIALYEADGGTESGFMREVNGITTAVHDHDHKRRDDYIITDQPLIGDLKARLARTLAPMIERAFQFKATRIERFIVACYDAQSGGHFRPHRDNTTAGTAHRRFACTINLNADDYVGGDLSFPEFGKRTYRAPPGGAVVFSCSLLHEARPVTHGRRYAFLPFLYDEAGAQVRERNLARVSPELRNYRSDAAGGPV